MRERIIKYTITIAAIIIIAAIAGLYHSYNRYALLSRDIMNNYRSNGENLSLLIEEAFNNSILTVNSFEENLYNEMIKDLDALYPIIIDEANTYSKGFFFSDIPENDSFVVYTIYNGEKYSVSRDRQWYEHIERISGPGKYIQNIGNINTINYIIIQDDMGIITATENIDSIYSIMSDKELIYAMVENEDVFREYEIYGNSVYEYIHPMKDNTLLRIGFEDSAVKNSIMQTRIMFASISGTIAVFIVLLAIIVILYMYNINTMERINAIDKQNTIYLNQLEEGVIILKNEKIQMVNNAAIEILGIRRDNIEEVINNINMFKTNDTGADDEINRQMHYGGKDILYTKKHIKDEKYSIITCSDITEFNRLKKENETKKQQAMLGELTFKVAHELKNPLNGMYMILQRIMENADKENRKLLAEAVEEVGRMNKRIVEFTRFARPIEYKKKHISAKDLIDDVVKSIQARAKLLNIEIHVKTESCTLFCDYEQMYIALKNIVINAIESIESRGRIDIEGTCQNDYIIYIKDNGTGMDENVQTRAFELYFTTKQDGSGIGLANAQRIITEHNGTLAIKSAKNQGTSVTITLKMET